MSSSVSTAVAAAGSSLTTTSYLAPTFVSSTNASGTTTVSAKSTSVAASAVAGAAGDAGAAGSVGAGGSGGSANGGPHSIWDFISSAQSTDKEAK